MEFQQYFNYTNRIYNLIFKSVSHFKIGQKCKWDLVANALKDTLQVKIYNKLSNQSAFYANLMMSR